MDTTASHERKEKARVFLRLLYSIYPDAFFPPEKSHLMIPLPINTVKLLCEAFPQQEVMVVRIAWTFYWRRRMYYEAVLRSTRVYDFQGKVIDNLSHEFKYKCRGSLIEANNQAKISKNKRAS